MRIKIKVGDIFLDTYEGLDDTFYITEQRYDIRALEQRKADYTRSISVPRTANNEAALNLQSNERQNNPKFGCFILIDEVTFVIGTLLVITYNQREAEIIIFGGNFELFDNLPLKSVRNLDLSAYSFPWTQAGIGATQTNTTGCTSVNTTFMDDASITDGVANVSQFESSFDIKNWGFGFFLKTLILEILNQSGYSVNFSPALIADDLYNEALIMCPVILPGSTEDIVTGTVNLTSNYTYDASVLLGVPDRVDFVILSDPAGMWSGVNSEWTVPTSGTWQIIFDYTISNDNNSNLGPAEVAILNDGQDIITREYYEVANVHQREIVSIEATAGDKIYIEVTAERKNNSKYDIVTIQSGALFTLQENLPDPTGTLIPQDWIPEMTQKEALIAFLKMFNCIISTNVFTQEVDITTWNEYVIKTPTDISNNILEGQDVQEETSIRTYYRQSLLTYNNDSVVERTDTDVELSFDDQSLPQIGTILTQFFSASDGNDVKMNVEAGSFSYGSATNFTATSGTPAFTFGQVEVFKPGDYIRHQGTTDTINRIRYATSGLGGSVYNNFTASLSNVDVQIITIDINDITPRIGRKKLSTNVTAFTRVNAYTGVTLLNTPVNIVTFDGLKWGELGVAYYRTLLKPLQSPKIITVWMTFDSMEFYNLDYSKPVYIQQLNGTFHINKVSQWKLNSPCLVELIRINILT